jgi:hypothetical protein
MSDQPNTPEPEETPSPSTPEPSAGTQNTVSTGEDNRVPYARFEEVNREKNELKARLEKLEKADEERKLAAMSDVERAKLAATEAASQVEQLKTQLEQERQQRLSDRRNNLVAQALASAQAIDADETVMWLEAHKSDELKAAMSDDGTADPDQIKKLVDLARAERPHHFRPGGPGSPSNRGGELPPANQDVAAVQAAEFLKRYGFEPNKERLAAFMHMHRDEQATQE